MSPAKKKGQAKPWYRQKTTWAGGAIVLNGILGALAIEWPHAVVYMAIADSIFLGLAVIFLRMSQKKIEEEVLNKP